MDVYDKKSHAARKVKVPSKCKAWSPCVEVPDSLDTCLERLMKVFRNAEGVSSRVIMERCYGLETAFFLLLFYSLFSVLTAEPVDEKIISNSTQEEEITLLFKQYVLRYNKTYVNDPREYYKRKEIFKQSLVRHSKLNQKEKELNGSAVYGINKFSDWTPQEFKDFLRLDNRVSSQLGMNANSKCKEVVLQGKPPLHFDWNKLGKVTAVKNQGKCGSCWAFTAVENIESQWAIKHGVLKELSVQELISCGAGGGCRGGNTCSALLWLLNNNYTVAPESEFPYQGKDTTCIEKTKYSKEGVRIADRCCNYTNPSEEDYMKPIIAFVGPMAVNVDATLWHDYLGGIIQHHCTDTDINHAVQITGYDETGEVPYWIVRNSWGADFGDKGYLYIQIGKNLCGLADEPSYVIV